MKKAFATAAIMLAAAAASAPAPAASFGHQFAAKRMIRGIPVMPGRDFRVIGHRPILGIIVHPRFPRGIIIDRRFGGLPGPFVRGVPVMRGF